MTKKYIFYFNFEPTGEPILRRNKLCYTRVYWYQIKLESILDLHHFVDPFPKCLAGFMSPKIYSLGTNKGHASTSKYCTVSDHNTDTSMCTRFELLENE